MLTLFILLAIGAAATTVAGAMEKCKWWVPVGLLSLIELLRVLPLR